MKSAYPNNQACPTGPALLLSGGTMAAPIAMGNNKVTGIANGTVSTDAAAFGQIPTALPPSGTAGGDLSGTYPNPTVAKINGVSLGSTAATLGNLLVASGSAWVSVAPSTVSLSSFGVPSGSLSIGTQKLTNVVDPAAAQDAATKNYVDLAVANLVSKADCQCATTTALAASTYANGSSGVGATITLTVAAVLILDGYTPMLNDRLLIKNQAAPAQNGIFSLTQVGVLGVTQAVLTRTTDFDQPAEVDGAITFISNGSTNGGTRWQCLASGTIVFGTTAINWSTFAGSTYTGDGSTITITGTTVSISGSYAGQHGYDNRIRDHEYADARRLDDVLRLPCDGWCNARCEQHGTDDELSGKGMEGREQPSVSRLLPDRCEQPHYQFCTSGQSAILSG